MPFKKGDIFTLPEEIPTVGSGWIPKFAGAIVELGRPTTRRVESMDRPAWNLSHITTKGEVRKTTAYWVLESWLGPQTGYSPMATSKCKCPLGLDPRVGGRGCFCGEFAREMTAKGKTYCPYLRSWVKK